MFEGSLRVQSETDEEIIGIAVGERAYPIELLLPFKHSLKLYAHIESVQGYTCRVPQIETDLLSMCLRFRKRDLLFLRIIVEDLLIRKVEWLADEQLVCVF